MNTVFLTAGAIGLKCLPGVLLVAALLALYGVGKGLRHVARWIHVRRMIRRLERQLNNPNVRARYSRKEKP